MDYNETATNGEKQSENLETKQNIINKLPFSSIWNGNVSTNILGALSDVSSKIDAEKAKMSDFFSSLKILNTYRKNKEAIARLKFQLMCIPDDEKHGGERAALQSQISQLEKENETLKTEIQNNLSKITSIFSSTSIVGHNVNLNYYDGLYEILGAYDLTLTEEEKTAGQTILRQLGGNQSLAEYYNSLDENGNVIQGSGYNYILNIITSITKTYSGREAAVNSALAMLKLASDKNVKLDYVHKGTTGTEPYVSTAHVLTGVDCNPWTSWCVDKGTPGGFQWRPVDGFQSVGTTIDSNNWNQAQPGDVFVTTNGSHHVGIIIANDPVNQRMICAEAKGQAVGIVLNYRSYNNLRTGGYVIKDMTNVYNGTENTNRPIFNNYVDMNSYQRVTL